MSNVVECPKCGASGYRVGNERCWFCDGSGFVQDDDPEVFEDVEDEPGWENRHER